MALRPDLYYRSVSDIDLGELDKRGVRALMLDLDNTLVPRNTVEVAPPVRAWIERVLEHGMGLCIVSNNWHERVQRVAEMLGIPIVDKGSKPLPGAFRRGLETLGVTPSEAAVVGDQLFTDVLGGSLIGATTVLVQPLPGGSDLPHTRVLRRIERRMLAGREPVAARPEGSVGEAR